MNNVFLCVTFLLAFSADTQGQCGGEADIVIAVPGSYNVPDIEFDTFENELSELLSHFNISRQEINIGLILYGKSQIRVASPQPFKTWKELNTRLTLLRRRSQFAHELNNENDVAGAIYAVHHMLQNPPTNYPREILRRNSRKIGVIFTYGTGNENNQAQTSRKIMRAADSTKRHGTLLYALSANGTVPGFAQIGSDYCRLFSMGSFHENLATAVPYFASAICSELDPTVQVKDKDCFPKRYGKRDSESVNCTGDSIILADPNNCAYYFRCEFGHAVRHECGIETLYDPHVKNCNYARFVECYSDISCPVPFGLFPHPVDCSRFINCFFSIPYIQPCAPGNLFDEGNGSCNAAQDVRCPPNKRLGLYAP